MKNKKTAYFMLPVVFAVWGIIGWKVYAAMRSKDDKTIFTSQATQKKTVDEQLIDTVQLIANYRDPFLDKEISPVQNRKPGIQRSKPEHVKKAEPVVLSEWPKVSYHGLVRQSGSEKSLGFLSIDGTSHFVKGDDAVADIKVGKLWKDSIELFWGKEKKVLKK